MKSVFSPAVHFPWVPRGGNKVLICHVATMAFLNQMQRRGRDAAEVAAAVNNLEQMDRQRTASLRLSDVRGATTFEK